MVRNSLLRDATPLETIPSASLRTVDYASQTAKVNSEFQVLWSSIMDEGPYKNPTTYEKVFVLLLCFAADSSDLAPEQEITNLVHVLEKRFHYHTQREYLDPNSMQRLQIQVNGMVASFVRERDGPDTLLMVYYAGHGRPGQSHGEMELFGHRSENDPEKRRRDSVVWNQTEDLLRPAEADVLQIFDCCHAGTLGLTKGEERKAFEYLAATRSTMGTPVPGENSFTSALIFALEQLLDKNETGRFTTVELLNMIKKHPPFPTHQDPMLSDRRKTTSVLTEGRIMLHPLHTDGSKGEPHSSRNAALDSVKRQDLTLQFEFSKELSCEDINLFGNRINALSDANPALGIIGVRYGGLEHSMVVRAIHQMRERVRRSSMKREGSSENISLQSSEEWSGRETPEPATPLSTNRNSPRIQYIDTHSQQDYNPSLLSPHSPVYLKFDQQQRGHKRQRSC